MEDPYRIEELGPARVPSPLGLGTEPDDGLADFTPEGKRVVADPSLDAI